MNYPAIAYDSQMTRNEFDLMYAPQGKETVSWNDPRLSKIELDHNGEVLTELSFEFSNSNALDVVIPGASMKFSE